MHLFAIFLWSTNVFVVFGARCVNDDQCAVNDPGSCAQGDCFCNEVEECENIFSGEQRMTTTTTLADTTTTTSGDRTTTSMPDTTSATTTTTTVDASSDGVWQEITGPIGFLDTAARDLLATSFAESPKLEKKYG